MGDDIVNVKAGVLDEPDWIDGEGKPKLEVYVERRIKWIPKFEGLLQLDSTYSVVEGDPGTLRA
jgi:hypothetical protein